MCYKLNEFIAVILLFKKKNTLKQKLNLLI